MLTYGQDEEKLRIGGMLDMKFLGGLHGVAIGVMDDKSIIFWGVGTQNKGPNPRPFTGALEVTPGNFRKSNFSSKYVM